MLVVAPEVELEVEVVMVMVMVALEVALEVEAYLLTEEMEGLLLRLRVDHLVAMVHQVILLL
jgi:hypothetical protein